MSVVSLLLNLGRERIKTTINLLVLDSAPTLQHSATATVTKNPIESRSGDPIDNFTDHVRLNNRTLQIDGFIAEYPISVVGSALNVVTGALSNTVRGAAGGGFIGGLAQQALAAGVGSIAGLILNRDENDIRYPKKAFEYLVELRDNRIPFNIVTSLTEGQRTAYRDMLLTSLSVNQTPEVGGSLRFSATFEQIKQVNTQEVFIPATQVSNPSGATKQDLGGQTASLAEGSETNTGNASAAKSLSDKLGLTERGSGL